MRELNEVHANLVKEVSVSTSLKSLETAIASARDAFNSLRGRIEPVLEQSPETDAALKQGPDVATCIPLVNAIDDATNQIHNLLRDIRHVHGKVRL